MTAATQDITTPRYDPLQVLAPLLQPGVDANTTIYAGTMVMVKSNGYAAPAAAGTAGSLGSVIGIANRQRINTTAAGFGSAGALQVEVDRGSFFLNLNADSTVTIANFGANVYASDDNTVSLSDGGGTRPLAGYLLSVPTTPGVPGLQSGGASTKVAVQVGMPSPWGATTGTVALSTVAKCRAVVTTLQAYGGTGTNVLTETSNGAISAADGVTLAAGDVVFIQPGTTNLTAAKDSGPWQVTSLGGASAKWVLTRPDWFSTGAVIPLGQVIDIGGEGTFYANTQWKSTAASGSAVIGTNDPSFYVGRITFAVTLATGFVKLGVSQTFPGLISTTTTGIEFTPTNFSGASSTISYRTGVYASGGSATAAGYMGTSTVSITALVAAGTFNTSDVSSGLLTMINW